MNANTPATPIEEAHRGDALVMPVRIYVQAN